MVMKLKMSKYYSTVSLSSYNSYCENLNKIFSLFERFGEYCDARMGYLPLNFVLGFFCNIIIRRWLKLYTSLGNIDKLVFRIFSVKWIFKTSSIALFVSAYVRGKDDRARQIRRNIIRYLAPDLRIQKNIYFTDTVFSPNASFSVTYTLAFDVVFQHLKQLLKLESCCLTNWRHSMQSSQDIRNIGSVSIGLLSCWMLRKQKKV